MRILYIDIDTLRPDHLGCYGYHRNTSPNIDRIASEGVRFTNCYVSDAPCLPSRAALYSGQCGIRNGAVNHGGARADLHIDSTKRDFAARPDNFILRLRRTGYYPVSFSAFGHRHASYWFYAGFREMNDTGRGGNEDAHEVAPLAIDWLERNKDRDNWYLHVNMWDPHTSYTAPEDQGNLFKDEPVPAWMTQEILDKNWNTYGPGCGQEPGGDYNAGGAYEGRNRMTLQVKTMSDYRTWIDGYDMGIWYADYYVGKILAKLEEQGILDDTLIMVSSDHGESMGEMAVYGDHQTADQSINRVPMIIRHPKGVGGKNREDNAIHYQFDCAATVIELAGGEVPESWDGKSFKTAFEGESADGRDSIVVANCAWACQRAARWDNYMMIQTYHSGFKNYPEFMLFDLEADPHEQNNLAVDNPDLVKKGQDIIAQWVKDELAFSVFPDPLETVLQETGPHHAQFNSPAFERYVKRLRSTERGHFADELEERKRKFMERLAQ